LVYYLYPASFAFSLINYSLTLNYPINPVISATVETVWVVTTTILAYLIFERIDV